MKRFSSLFRMFRHLSFKRMNLHIREVHEESGASRVRIFFDMIWCSLKYGIGYLDYHVFGFVDKPARVRKTYMTAHHNVALVRKMNDRDYYYVFDDKCVFDKWFSDFLGRKFMDLRESDAADLKAFCEGHESVFAKATEKCGGADISRVAITPDLDYDALYKELSGNGQFLIEEAIVQHPDMNRLCPSSVNTVRIVTLLLDDGAHFVYALVRMSNGSAVVDNISSGGMYTSVHEDGTLYPLAFCDKTGLTYEEHPMTHTRFADFRIPFFDEAVDMCKRAAEIEPHMRYVGWDVAITPDGPVFVEGNNLPGYDMCQNAHHRSEGLLPTFEKILGEKIG